MPLLQDLLKKLHDFLATSDLFKSVPLSLLLIGLEALLDPHFSCPCRVLQNRLLTVAIFIGPALFTFFLMFLFVRPFRHGWFHCPDGVNDDTQKNWPKVLISCLIPPVMWIFLLFHDGEYFTCGMTDWDGCYVFNEKLGRSWCHPYPEGNIMWCDTSSEDHGKMHHTLEYFHNSEFIGYCVISVFSVLAVVFVGIYDCFVTGKCDCLPNQLLCCCRRRLPYSGVSAMEGADVTLRANTEIQTGDEIFWMFGYDNSLVAKNTGEESEFSDDRFKDKVDLNPQTGNLTIKRIETIHTGKYKLKIIRNGKASFKKFNVTLSEQVNESVLKGDPVTLEYDTEIQRDDEIQWKFEEKLIAEMTGRNRENLQSSDEFRGQMKLHPLTGSLTIEETRSEHSGLYKLEINTRDYSTFRLFSLTVWVKSVSVMKGADVTLPANIEIQRGDEIFWMFGDHNWLLAKNTKEESEFSDDRFKDKVYLDHQTRNLTIKKTETDHTGEYKLKIIRNGKSSFKIFSVTVYDEEESVSVMEGADVTLPANPEIQRGDEIFWMFGDHNWLLAKNTEERCEEESECSDSRFKDKMDLNHQTGNLTIRKTETNHTGKYKLKIIRNGKSSFKLFTVTVSENQNTAGTAAAPDETTAAGSNQNQNTAESIEMSILTNQQNQETPLDSVVSQT